MAKVVPLTVLFSGGGTAGHLAPGFALAHALSERGVRCLFCTPGEAVEAAWFHGRPAPQRVRAPRLPRTPADALHFPARLGQGVKEALALLRRERVGGVIALGGWPCAPVALAARLAGRPLGFVVSDAVAGVVVRRLAPLAQRFYLAQEAARADLGAGPRARVTGALLRPGVLGGQRDVSAFGLDPARRTLLIVGGSLGARGLNTCVQAGLEAAVGADPGLRERVQILQAAGPDAALLQAAYQALGLSSYVRPYLVRMADAYACADLVLARAGASTCAEILALSRPAVLVPYPHHSDQQQFKNAEPLVASGGAELVPEQDLTPERFRRSVVDLLLDPAQLAARAHALAGTRVDGAAETAEDWIRFLGECAHGRSLAR